MKVPWLSRQEISQAALRVIDDYGETVGYPIEPPIPVEDIIERGLGLKLGFVDFEKREGMKGVLGATYVGAELICINEGLLEKGPEGRLIFTCAHEVGHWVLHRQYADGQKRQGAGTDRIICRTRNAKEPIEWQADYFAASLLMPERELCAAFDEVFQVHCLILHNRRSTTGRPMTFIEPCVEHWPYIADMMCQAGGFTNVSRHAMIIRLQELGLLINQTDAPLEWFQDTLS